MRNTMLCNQVIGPLDFAIPLHGDKTHPDHQPLPHRLLPFAGLLGRVIRLAAPTPIKLIHHHGRLHPHRQKPPARLRMVSSISNHVVLSNFVVCALQLPTWL